MGHDTDNCLVLKHNFQDLIQQKKIPNPFQPNIAHNPIPNLGLNAITSDEERPDHVYLIRSVPKKDEKIINTFEPKSSQGQAKKARIEENVDKLDEILGWLMIDPSYHISHVTKTPMYNPLVDRWTRKMNFIPEGGLRVNQRDI